MSLARLTALVPCAALVSLLQLAPTAATADERVSCSTTGQTTNCRIDEPNVKQRITTYPQITFRSGDRVVVQAGGCVQTGGSGATWKRYVNPSGPNADRLYHGLIQLPGVQSDLVRVAGVVGRAISIPATLTPQNSPLHLGYEDDNYGDNGYWGHDDGTENQCKGVGNAWVTLSITHNAPPVTGNAAPFDLVVTQTDPNDFPFNPEWAWQRDHAGALPDADTQCFNLPGIFSNPGCTTQSPSIDVPDGWNSAWCSVGAAHSIHGHVNWMPGTWQGNITWDGHSAPGTDDDYNINLVPPNQAGLTVSSSGSIHSEFDSDETIDHFDTPWWRAFHSAVDNGDASARAMVDGKLAVVMGLTGLDCEHGCATEMHPVYALAIHTNSDPQDDTWAIFARNWGDEGYCSQEQHPLDTTRIAFMIPHAGASAVQVNVATTFLTNNSQVSGPAVSVVSGQGAVVEFGLPGPDAGARLNGELHLQWTGGAAGGSPAARAAEAHVGPMRPPAAELATRAPASTHAPAPESEARLASLVQQLPPAKLNAIKTTLARPQAFDNVKPRALAATTAKPTRPATARAVVDVAKKQRDAARARAICAAYNNNVPGMPANACASVPR